MTVHACQCTGNRGFKLKDSVAWAGRDDGPQAGYGCQWPKKYYTLLSASFRITAGLW